MDIITVRIIIFTTILFFLILTFGSYYLRFEYYLPSINKLSNNGKSITLTFDDKLLEILKKHDVKAMFFCIGNSIENNFEIAKSIVDHGHILGNHSYSHSNTFALSSYKIVENDISKTNTLIESITSKKNNYFRPPFGVTNPIIARVIANNNLKVIGWSLRSFDTVISSEKLLIKLKTRVKHNDIILLHDLENTLSVIDEFIKFAKHEGYNFVLPYSNTFIK